MERSRSPSRLSSWSSKGREYVYDAAIFLVVFLVALVALYGMVPATFREADGQTPKWTKLLVWSLVIAALVTLALAAYRRRQ